MADHEIAAVQQPMFLSGLSPPSVLVLEPAELRTENWKLFKQQWKNFQIVAHLDKADNQYQVAMFLSCIGKESLKLYNAFQFISVHFSFHVQTGYRGCAKSSKTGAQCCILDTIKTLQSRRPRRPVDHTAKIQL